MIQAYVLEQGFGHGFFGTMVAAIPLLTILVSVPMLGVLADGARVVRRAGRAGVHVAVGGRRDASRDVAGLLALTLIIPLSSALSNTFIKWKLPHVPAAPLTTMLLVVAGIALLPLQLSPQLMNALAHCGADASATVSADGDAVSVLAGRRRQRRFDDGVRLAGAEERAAVCGDDDVRGAGARAVVGHARSRGDQRAADGAIAGVLAMVALVQTGPERPASPGSSDRRGDLVTSLPISAEAERR